MKKLVVSLFIVLLLIVGTFFAINPIEENDYSEEEARNDFSQFYDENFDTVMLFQADYLIFNNHEIDLEEIIPGNKQCTIVSNDGVFSISTTVRTINIFNSYNESIDIWKTDLYGNDKKIVFQIKNHGKIKDVESTKNKDSFYIKYKIDKLYYVDYFNVINYEYFNVDIRKKDFNFYEEYAEKDNSIYSGRLIRNYNGNDNDVFKILNKSTGIVKYVNEDNLKLDNVYEMTANKYIYYASLIKITNNRVYLFYSINAGDLDDYSYSIFEYNFEANTLEFKMLVFLYDCINMEMIHIG